MPPPARPERALPAALALCAAACAPAAPCPPGRPCGAAVWSPPSGVAAADGVMVVAPATDASERAPGVQPEQLRLGGRPVLVRFDLARVAGRGRVQRAVLSLAPHDAWRPGGGPVTLVARAVL